MAQTGAQIVTAALRELGVIDPVETVASEIMADGLQVASDLVDNWRTHNLTIPAITRSVYNLVTNQQAYTIGSGGDFNQTWPSEIRRWAVIPDDDATDVTEQYLQRSLTYEEWASIPTKSYTAAYPTRMYYDGNYAAGLGTCNFYPIPDNNDVDVVLYSLIPALTSIAQNTSYDLQPGAMLALKLKLAVRLAPRNGIPLQSLADLVQQANDAFGDLKRRNSRPVEIALRHGFGIRGSSQDVNIRTLEG